MIPPFQKDTLHFAHCTLHFLLLLILSACQTTDQTLEQTPSSPPVWPDGFEAVVIPSTSNSMGQKAYFRTAQTPDQPLAVVLHTWSSDYAQIQHNLAQEALERDWNYIHPDFQGPNRQPTACCSPSVIDDIHAAIDYALAHSNANPEAIHILGASGGGYATLCFFMQGQQDIASYSAWVPISDLSAWYYESVGRQNRYADEVKACTDSGDTLNEEYAQSRSPLYMSTPTDKLQASSLNIFAGIHDGYTGSVPISHSLYFYNKMISDHGLTDAYRIPEETINYMIRTRTSPENSTTDRLGNQPVLFQRATQSIRLAIFEGGHEMIDETALDQIFWFENRPRAILTIGDSNGASKTGWVHQLQSLRPKDTFLNYSKSGNTIGFDNLDNPQLNTLRQMDSYLKDASEQLAGVPINEILINLGTNDSKAIFEDNKNEVPAFLTELIQQIQKFPFDQIVPPRITVISPPPYGPDAVLQEKYHGGAARVEQLVPAFKEVARATGSSFIDIHSLLKDDFSNLAPDGVHMKEEGQQQIAQAINEFLAIPR